MKVTEQDRELIMAFVRILKTLGISKEAATLIVAMLKDAEQLDSVVTLIEQNPQITENQLIEAVQELSQTK